MRAFALRAAAAAAVSGCASAPEPVPVPAHYAVPATSRHTVPLPVEREVRYYTDEVGDVWDDRGRKLGRPPVTLARP